MTTGRTVTAGVQSALAAANVPMLCFVSMAFSSGTVYVTNAGYNFDWDGHTWLGLGRLGSIETVKETPDLAANSVNLKLTGVPAASVSQALTENYQGRACIIYLAPLDQNYTILADPVQVFSGRMNTMDVELGQTATITLNVESRLADWDRPRVRRYNDADQQAEYPGDLGLQYVEQMVEKVLDWTTNPVSDVATGGTGLSSYVVGDMLYADSTTSLEKLHGVATGNAIISGGIGAVPSWGKVVLTTHVSGTLPVENGGTGATTLTGILQGTGTTAVTVITDSSTVGQVLRVTGANAYAWGALDLSDPDAVTGAHGPSNYYAAVH